MAHKKLCAKVMDEREPLGGEVKAGAAAHLKSKAATVIHFST